MTASSGASEQVPPASDVRQRAVAGAALLGLRGVLVNALMAIGGGVLAGLLEPRDFGVLALGLTITNSTRFLADAGIGASFIRQESEPDEADLRALLSFQLLITTGAAALGAAVAVQFGESGQVIALMLASLPFATFRTPGMAMAERHLLYRGVAWVEILEAVTFNVVAISAVLGGFGLWGVAVAAIARSAVGSATMIIVGPVTIVRPRWSWRRTKGLLAFGGQYQAVGLVNVIRDQGLAAGTAAIGGLSVLGLWSLAYRVIQIPMVFFGALWRVSYPAMARMQSSGENLGPIMERATTNIAVAACLLLVILSSAAPAAIPALLGEVWEDASRPIPFAFLGLAIAGPVSVAAAGFLYAAGDASTVLRSAIIHTITLFVLGFSLLAVFGVLGLGLAALGGSLVEGSILARAVTRRVGGTNLLTLVVAPTASATVAGGVGWVVATWAGPTLISAGLAAFGAALLFVVVLGLASPSALRDAWEFGRRVSRRAF